jgi:hypothetical protein
MSKEGGVGGFEWQCFKVRVSVHFVHAKVIASVVHVQYVDIFTKGLQFQSSLSFVLD